MENTTQSSDTASREALFLANLRERTTASHQQLESLPLSKSLMREDVTLDDYARYLLYMRDVMRFFDRDILPSLQHIIPGADSRAKLQQIQNDLDYLNQQGIDVEAPLSSTMHTIDNEAHAMGMAYVIEGSTLGGRVIMKHIVAKLPVTETSGGEFFAGYKQETGPMWKSFLAALTSYATTDDREEVVIQGAVDGFDMIARHFEQSAVVK